MKLIQGMKQIKDLQQKASDIRTLIKKHCADLSWETPPYPDQTSKVAEWVQSHEGLCKEILRLRVAIQRTNLATQVTIRLGDKDVTKSLAEWIHVRRDLSGLMLEAWQCMTDRNLKEGDVRTGTDGPVTKVTIRRYFNPSERDAKVTLFRSEPGIIDAHLETVNAVTDLIEA